CCPPASSCLPHLRPSNCLPRLAGILHRYKTGVPSNQHAEYSSPQPKFHPVPTHPVFEPLPAYPPLASLDPRPASKLPLAPTPAARLRKPLPRLAWPLLAAAVITASAAATELRNSPIVKAIQDAEPAVVSIHGRKTVRAENASYGASEAVRQVNGMGTGIVIDS